MLDSLSIRIALKVISSKLPIGVATKYNVPVMLKKIVSCIVLVFILTCCTLSSNEYSLIEDDYEEFKSKNLVLSSSRLNSNIDIIFFEDKDIIHVKGSINPSDDFNDINLELILSDLNQVTKYLDRINKKKMEQKEKNRLSELLSSLIMHLEEEKFVSNYEKIEELYKIPDLKLLTSKPMFIIANIDDGYDKEILNAFKNTLSENQKCIVIDTKIEQEISQLSPEEQFEFLKELEISDTALNQIIQTGYQLLGLKTFFTSGEKETRAWSAKKEFNAGQCSGIIHTDIERGFIRAETVSYNDYISHNGEQGSKDNGVWRQEGKDYIVNEGDVIYFRFNV